MSELQSILVRLLTDGNLSRVAHARNRDKVRKMRSGLDCATVVESTQRLANEAHLER